MHLRSKMLLKLGSKYLIYFFSEPRRNFNRTMINRQQDIELSQNPMSPQNDHRYDEVYAESKYIRPRLDI